MLNKFFAKFKFLIVPIICTLLGLTFLSMVFNLINVGSVAKAMYIVCGDIIIMSILGFMLFARLKGNKEWFTMSVVIFFSYLFVATARSVFAPLVFDVNAIWIDVILGLFNFFANIALTTVAIALILTIIIKKEKFVKIVNEIISWGIVAYLGIISLVFILTIVGAIMPTAVTTFAIIPAVLFNFAFGVFFAILINYNVKVETPVKEKKVEEVAEEPKEEPKEEPIAVIEEPITEEKVEVEEEKAEEPAVVSEEEPAVVFAEEPVATEPVAEEKPVKEKKAKKKVDKKEKKAEKKEKKEKKAKTPSNFEGGVVDVIGPANQTDKK